MKYFFNLIFAFLFFGSYAIQGQSCDSYPYMQEGKTFTANNLDKKGKVETVAISTVKSVKNNGGNFEATLSVQVRDPKGNDLMVLPIVISCDADGMYFDMSSMFNNEMMAGFGDMEVSSNKDLIRIPKDISLESELRDGKATLSVAEGAMNFSVSFIDREVLAKESITIDGKSHECYKISYTNLTEMGFIKTRTQVTEWWSKDLLMVKSETYNKKGKLMSATEMVKID